MKGRKRTHRFRWTAIAIMVVAGYGVLVYAAKLPPYDLVRSLLPSSELSPGALSPIQYPTSGRWRRAEPPPHMADLTEAQKERVEQLRSIGYLTGSEPATGREHVTVHDPEAAYQGLNLYTSGHAPEALLMDMNGKVLHRWKYAFHDAFPGYRVPADMTGADYFRRVHLFENGDLLAIYEGLGLIKLDRDSNLLWAYRGQCHHDLHVAKDGSVYVLTRQIKVIPEIHREEPVLEDFITILDAGGNVVRDVSVLRAFQLSRYEWPVKPLPERGDIFHTNTLEILDGSHTDRSTWFKKGNLLVSLLEVNMIAIVDPETESVVWALSGPWDAPHQPTLLPNGNILLFDNRRHGDFSKVIEFDPFTGRVVWAYEGNSENGFFTRDCGSAERLPNGNTLITESNAGRAFEVTQDNEIVWEFYNPYRAGENQELVATVLEVVRLRPDFPVDWPKR
jgi:hypothetical protein